MAPGTGTRFNMWRMQNAMPGCRSAELRCCGFGTRACEQRSNPLAMLFGERCRNARRIRYRTTAAPVFAEARAPQRQEPSDEGAVNYCHARPGTVAAFPLTPALSLGERVTV